MSKKIRQLARRSGATNYYGTCAVNVFCFSEAELNQFAESIISECIYTVMQLQDDVDRQNWPTPYGCAEAISEHFGIE